MIVWLMAVALGAKVQCDAGELDKAAEAIATMEAKHLAVVATVALTEACRLPAPVAEALRDVPRAPPEMAPMLDMRLAAVAPERVEQACPGGLKALSAVATLAPADKRPRLWRSCAVALSPFVTEAEWTASSGLVVAPLLFGPWLVELGAEPQTARALTRALAGISDRPQDNPVRRFQPLVP